MTEETKSPETAPESRPAKRNWRKVVLIILLVLVLLVVGILLTLNSILKAGVTTVGSQVTGTAVTVNSINLSPFRGSLAIDTLAVGNPEGFQMPSAISFDSLNVELDLASLTTDKIIVNQVEIYGLNIDYELSLSGSNLGTILKNVEDFVAKITPASDESKDSAPQEESAPAKQVVIRKLVAKQGTITFANKTLAQNLDIPLPPVEMENLGEGMAYPEMIQQFFVELLAAVTDAISSVKLPDVDLSGISEDLSAMTSDLSGKMSESLDSVNEGLKGVGDNLKEAGDNLSKTVEDVGNLFKFGE